MLQGSQLVRIGGATDPRVGKKQQRFNALTKKIDHLRSALRAWRDTEPQIHGGLGKLRTLVAEHSAVVAEIVRALDRAYDDKRLTKDERSAVRRLLCNTARDLLAEGGPDDLKAIYKRHTRRDFDREHAAEQAAEARMMQFMLEDVFGFDFAGRDIRSVEDVQRATREQLDALEDEAEREADAEAARRASRKKSARQVASEQRREAERAQVSKALQEVYRKLAVALHPDREQDAAERARKTALMAALNVAYEAKDLLALLELQLRCEQLDPAHLDELPEDRLDRYIKLLSEQVAQLRGELAEVEMPWRMQLELSPSAKLPPARVLLCLEDDVARAAADIRRARLDLVACSDVTRLKTWLRGTM